MNASETASTRYTLLDRSGRGIFVFHRGIRIEQAQTALHYATRKALLSLKTVWNRKTESPGSQKKAGFMLSRTLTLPDYRLLNRLCLLIHLVDHL